VSDAAGPSKNTAKSDELEEVIVTGTSIRARHRSDRTSSTRREAIEATSVQSRAAAAEAGTGHHRMAAPGKADTAPSTPGSADIRQHHGLGGVSSKHQLILIDGHRIPLTGTSATRPIPTCAAERSRPGGGGCPKAPRPCMFGRVAGVINCVTASSFEANARAGLEDNTTLTAALSRR